MRDDIREGARFPNYVLPDHLKTMRRLSDLQGDDPMIVVLSRGFFCPKDREQLHELVRFHPQLVVSNVRVVTITTDDWHTINNLRQQISANWPFLYDEGRIVQQDLQIQEYTDPTNNPMVPHTFVLAPGLRIYKIWNGYYYVGRPSTAELHGVLRDLTREIRPDFDLGAPGLRQRWEAGEKEAFYPYGRKSMEDQLAEMAGDVDRYAPDAGGKPRIEP